MIESATSALASRRLELIDGLSGSRPNYISAKELFELADQSCASSSEPMTTLISCRVLDQLPDEQLGWVLDALFAAGRKRLGLMLLGSSSPRIYRRCGNLRPSSEMLLHFVTAEEVTGTPN